MGERDAVLFEVKDSIGTITINRPEVRNALSRAMVKQMSAWLEEAATRDDVRVVVIRGAGDRAFCADHDLKELAAEARTGEEDDPSIPFAGLCLTLLSWPKPTIAAVRGFARQAGVWLCTSCDLLVAAEDATFALTSVRFGEFPFYPMVPVMRRIGRSRALDMILSIDVVEAADAKQMGLADRLVPVERFEDAVNDLARKIASRDPQAVRAGKEALRLLVDLDTERQVRVALQWNMLAHRLQASDDRAQRIDAHLASVRGTGPTRRSYE
ncbi:MAG: enoyl-CoA hydratase/isomerase family protein [Chloroflexi bacterium]|nr:enoyl-CoA hydratase/isomerase family protein [Chloroflexota bacterium]